MSVNSWLELSRNTCGAENKLNNKSLKGHDDAHCISGPIKLYAAYLLM